MKRILFLTALVVLTAFPLGPQSTARADDLGEEYRKKAESGIRLNETQAAICLKAGHGSSCFPTGEKYYDPAVTAAREASLAEQERKYNTQLENLKKQESLTGTQNPLDTTTPASEYQISSTSTDGYGAGDTGMDKVGGFTLSVTGSSGNTSSTDKTADAARAAMGAGGDILAKTNKDHPFVNHEVAIQKTRQALAATGLTTVGTRFKEFADAKVKALAFMEKSGRGTSAIQAALNGQFSGEFSGRAKGVLNKLMGGSPALQKLMAAANGGGKSGGGLLGSIAGAVGLGSVYKQATSLYQTATSAINQVSNVTNALSSGNYMGALSGATNLASGFGVDTGGLKSTIALASNVQSVTGNLSSGNYGSAAKGISKIYKCTSGGC